MSKPRAYTEETLEIIARFFQTIDFLVSAKQIRGKATYDRKQYRALPFSYSIERPFTRFFQVSWLLGLIKDYNISAD